jgi:hypothetical protein
VPLASAGHIYDQFFFSMHTSFALLTGMENILGV